MNMIAMNEGRRYQRKEDSQRMKKERESRYKITLINWKKKSYRYHNASTIRKIG